MVDPVTMPPILAIAGPTASGKSGFALQIAHAIDGEIINADAVQIYEPLQILSARPTQMQMQNIPHHLYGFLSGEKRYSAGAWLRAVTPIILQILARGKVPIITGGTGLYFKALTEGLADIPPISPEVEQRVTAVLHEYGPSHLRDLCQSCDPIATSRVIGDNPHRLMRILAVFWQTGQALSHLQKVTRPIIPPRFITCCVLMPERDVLYQRINMRYTAMIEQGAIDEAKALLAQGFPPSLPVMKAIGLPPLLRYLNAEITRDEALAQGQQDTRRFAKRQMTWFRNQTRDWPKLHNSAERVQFIEMISDAVERR